MRSSVTSVAAYIAALPADRRSTLDAVRTVILANLDPELEEGMQYGMIGYYVPHRAYPAGYHTNPKEPLPFLALASQKQNLALYLMHLYADSREAEWFEGEWKKSGKKLDMGKACLRFRKVDDLALDVLAEALRRTSAKAYIELYERQRAAKGPPPVTQPREGKAVARTKTARKAPAKKAPAKKAPGKKAPGKKAPGKKAPGKKAPGKKAPRVPR